MLDFNDRESVRNNILVAKELIKHLSVTELMKLYANAHPDEKCTLDFNEIVEGILETNDDGKILVLALNGSWNPYDSEVLVENQILKIAERSTAHKAAILSNSRILWYRFDSFRPTIRKQLLIPTILSDDELAHLLCANPRIDRKFIAEIIRGQNEFSILSITQRMEAAYVALNTVAIEYNSNDISEPIEACYALLKELDETDKLKNIDIDTIGFSKTLNKNDFRINVSDWISCDEKQLIESSEAEWSIKFDKEKKLAIHNFIDWAIKYSSDAPVQPVKYTYRLDDQFNRGYMAIVMIRKALSSFYTDIDTRNELMVKLSTSDKWVARASYYSLKLDQTLFIYPFDDILDLMSVSDTEKLVLLHGFLANEKYYFFKYIVEIGRMSQMEILFISDFINHKDKMFNYLNETMFDYMNDCFRFGIGRAFNPYLSPKMEKSEIEDLIRKHNTSALNSKKGISDRERKKIQRIIDGHIQESPGLFFYLRKAVFYSFIAIMIYLGVLFFNS